MECRGYQLEALTTPITHHSSHAERGIAASLQLESMPSSGQGRRAACVSSAGRMIGAVHVRLRTSRGDRASCATGRSFWLHSVGLNFCLSSSILKPPQQFHVAADELLSAYRVATKCGRVFAQSTSHHIHVYSGIALRISLPVLVTGALPCSKGNGNTHR